MNPNSVPHVCVMNTLLSVPSPQIIISKPTFTPELLFLSRPCHSLQSPSLFWGGGLKFPMESFPHSHIQGVPRPPRSSSYPGVLQTLSSLGSGLACKSAPHSAAWLNSKKKTLPSHCASIPDSTFSCFLFGKLSKVTSPVPEDIPTPHLDL